MSTCGRMKTELFENADVTAWIYYVKNIIYYFLVHDCETSEDTYMKAFPVHVAVDHNHNRFDNEFSFFYITS